MTIRASKLWIGYAIAMAWFYVLLWPLLGIKPQGLEFGSSLAIWFKVAIASAVLLGFYQLKQAGVFSFMVKPTEVVSKAASAFSSRVPMWLSLCLVAACAVAFPFFT